MLDFPGGQQSSQGLPVGASHSITASWLRTGSPDTKAEGLEGQINRLADLIGRLEDKVRASVSMHGAVPWVSPQPHHLPALVGTEVTKRWPCPSLCRGMHGPQVGAGLLVVVVEDITSDELTAAIECGTINCKFI